MHKSESHCCRGRQFRSDLNCGKVRLRQRISFLHLHHLVDQAVHRACLDESETDDPPACVSEQKVLKVFVKFNRRLSDKYTKDPRFELVAADSEVHLT